MEKIRLVRLLKKIKKEEIDRFYYFVNSPFFDLPAPIRRLLNYLRNLYPEFRKEDWDRKAMWLNSYPDKKYEPRRLNDLMWETCVAMEDYFVTCELKHQPAKHGDLLKENYRRRSLPDEYEAQLDKLVRYYHKDTEVSFEQSVNHIHILNELLFLLKRDTNEMHKDTYGNPLEDFEECLQRIRLFGEINLEIFAKGAMMHGTRLDFKYKKGFLTFKKDADARVLQNTPLLELLLKLRKLYTEPVREENLRDFQEVVDMFTEHVDTFSVQETARLYVLLQNIAAKFRMTKALKILFPTTKIAAVKGAVGGGKDGFSELTFINIVNIGSRIKEFDYIETFIHDFSPLLNPKVYQNTKNFALLTLEFNRKNYREVPIYAGRIDFKDLRYKLNMKALVIRSYYEMLGEEDSDWVNSMLRAQLRSFSKYLRRTKSVPKNLYVVYTNFNVVLRKILTIYLRKKREQKNIKNLFNILESNQPVYAGEWLTDKIEEIEKTG